MGYARDGRSVDPGPVYGDRKISALLAGSGGSGAHHDSQGSGGAGGGAIEVKADGTGDVTIGSGVQISVNGGDASSNRVGGAGSGGAIRVEGRNVTNEGILSAIGKQGKHDRSGAGGGGRIALIAREKLVPGSTNVSGGINNRGTATLGEDGTLRRSYIWR